MYLHAGSFLLFNHYVDSLTELTQLWLQSQVRDLLLPSSATTTTTDPLNLKGVHRRVEGTKATTNTKPQGKETSVSTKNLQKDCKRDRQVEMSC